MKFGWINLFGGLIVAIMLIPNIIYAIKYKGEKNLCKNKLMNVPEQVSRYACIILMWLPLLVWEFGFSTKVEALIYMFGNGFLLFEYLLVFALHLRKRTRMTSLILAVLPASIFLMSGLLLHHWLLVAFAAVFGYSHLYVTVQNLEPKDE